MSIVEGKREVKTKIQEVLKYSFKVEDTKKFFGDLHSECFDFDERTWFIQLEHGRYNSDSIGIFLHNISEETVIVTFRTSILVKDKVVKTDSFTNQCKKGGRYGWPEFISKKYLFQQISSPFSLIVVCEMQIIDDPKFKPSIELNILPNLREVCNKNFHDLKIQAKNGDQILSAHRFLISAYSPVLYEEILKLDGIDPLKIEDFCFETIQEIINFIYGKGVNKTNKNVKEILLAAKKYKIEDLQDQCEKFIFQKLTLENALENLIFAYENDVKDLLKKISNFMDKNIYVLLKNQKTQWEQVVAEHPRIINLLFIRFVTRLSEKLKKNCTLTVKHINESSSTLVDDYEYLFESMEFSDVVLEVEGKPLKAHKCILISYSTVFRAMFAHETWLSKKNRVKISDVGYDTMNQLLQYIYCGKVTGLKENAVDLFLAAYKYNILKLQLLCKYSMERNVTVKNVTEMFKLADLHPSYFGNLKLIATNFLKKNVFSVVFSTEWGNFAESNARILSDMLIKFLNDLK